MVEKQTNAIAVSRPDLSHQLGISRINSRLPEVPTIRLTGFPYLQEGLLNAGYLLHFFCFLGRDSLGRRGVYLARFARLTSVGKSAGHQLAFLADLPTTD